VTDIGLPPATCEQGCCDNVASRAVREFCGAMRRPSPEKWCLATILMRMWHQARETLNVLHGSSALLCETMNRRVCVCESVRLLQKKRKSVQFLRRELLTRTSKMSLTSRRATAENKWCNMKLSFHPYEEPVARSQVLVYGI
jgi:hypothetical protein